MNTELEDHLALSLRDRADREVDTDTLLAGALTLGQRRVTRQRLGALAVVAVLIVATLLFGALRPYPVGGHRTAAPGASAVWNDLTPRSLDSRLVTPAAPAGTPTALDDPAVVGSDPGLLHLSVAALPGHYVVANWTAGRAGGESLALTDADEYARAAAGASNTAEGVVVHLSNRPNVEPGVPSSAVETGAFTLGSATVTDYLVPSTDTGGRAGPTYRVLAWQPAAGLSIVVNATADDRKARLIAAAVRLTSVHRCVVPFRLDQPPAGTGAGCQLTLTTPRAGTVVKVQDPTATYTLTRGSAILRVNVTRHAGTRSLCEPTSGYPVTVPLGSGSAQWYGTRGVPGEGQLTVCQPAGGLAVQIEITGTGYTEDDALRAAGAVRPVPRLDRPDSWPASPLA